MTSKAELVKQANALITLFISSYKEKHNREPVINRYKQKWGFQDMLSDIGYEGSVAAMEYFFDKRVPEHSVSTLLNNYERYAKVNADLARDKEDRLRLREETRLRVERMEANVHDSSGSN